MFEVGHLCNGWVKKDGVTANLVLSDWPNFKYPIDFAFSPTLTLFQHPVNFFASFLFKSAEKNFSQKLLVENTINNSIALRLRNGWSPE